MPIPTDLAATLPEVMAELQLLSGSWPDEPGLDTALSKVVLDAVSAGEMPATLRLYTPGREVAFGRRDAVSAEYPAAVAAATQAGFASVERLAGGRAAVFTEHTIAFALSVPDPDPRITISCRFQEIGDIMVAAFRALGVAAEIGEVLGEYCPGEFSVNHKGRIKLMGVGQRLARTAAHVGGVVVVDRTDLLLRALIPVYRALGLEWRPHTAGSLGDVNPGLSNEDVVAALRAEFGKRYDLRKDRVSTELVERAAPLVEGFLPPPNEGE